MLPTLYYQIKDKENIKINLEKMFDFIIAESINTEEYWFYAKEKLTILATSASGGVYATIAKGEDIEKFPIVFISSEGKAGKIAKSFSELIQLIIYYPYWQDMLSFSGGGDFEKMIKSIPCLEDERIEFHSNYKRIQKEISDELGLVKDSRLLENLLKEVMEKPFFRVFSTEDDNMSDTLIDI